MIVALNLLIRNCGDSGHHILFPERVSPEREFSQSGLICGISKAFLALRPSASQESGRRGHGWEFVSLDCIPGTCFLDLVSNFCHLSPHDPGGFSFLMTLFCTGVFFPPSAPVHYFFPPCCSHQQMYIVQVTYLVQAVPCLILILVILIFPLRYVSSMIAYCLKSPIFFLYSNFTFYSYYI